MKSTIITTHNHSPIEIRTGIGSNATHEYCQFLVFARKSQSSVAVYGMNIHLGKHAYDTIGGGGGHAELISVSDQCVHTVRVTANYCVGTTAMTSDDRSPIPTYRYAGVRSRGFDCILVEIDTFGIQRGACGCASVEYLKFLLI